MSTKRTAPPAFKALTPKAPDPNSTLSAAGLRRPGSTDDLAASLGLANAPQSQVAPKLGFIEPASRTVTSEADLAALVVGDVVEISVGLLNDHPRGARLLYRHSEVDDTAVSLEQHGQDHSAKVWIAEGKAFVMDGGKRLRGARARGQATLRADIIDAPADMLEAWLESRRLNVERSDHTIYDDAVRFKEMLDEGLVKDQLELAAKVSPKEGPPRTQGYISQIVSIASVPRHLMAKLVDYPSLCSKNAAYQIARLFNADKKPETEEASRIIDQVLAAAHANPDLTAAEVKAIVEKALGNVKSRASSTAVAARAGEYEGKLTIIPERGVVRLEFEGIKDAADIAALRAMLERIEPTKS